MKNLPYMGQCRITKLYGTPPPAGKKYSTGKHAGIDMVGMKDKSVYVIRSGKVYKTGFDPDGWGNYVVVEQDDGYFAIYAHLKEVNAILRKGKVVIAAFHTVGIEGATGNVTGVHLHLEIRKNYADKFSTIDPAEYLGIKNKLGVVEMKEQESEIVSSWAAADWKWAKEQGLLDGTRPKDPVTREELAAILHRLFTMS